MGIKSKKNRPSLLGSTEVPSLQPEIKEEVQSQQQTAEAVTQELTNNQMGQMPPVHQQSESYAVQPVYAQQTGQPEQGIQNPVAYQTAATVQQGSQPLVKIPHSHIVQQEMYIKPVKPMGIPGRKRRQLIPGEPEKMISMELPVALITKVQEYGRQYGLTMKEVIGYILLEKFK